MAQPAETSPVAASSSSHHAKRRLPIGAELVEPGLAHFRVWAPAGREVAVVFADGRDPVALVAEADGYFSGAAPAAAGDRYQFRVGGSDRLLPDPASRSQPDGPHGASAIVDPTFAWTDGHWRGLGLGGQVLYEMHVGTFTREGTWAAAARELPALRDLGITTIEMMPIAEFDGRFGWGYDGVDLFAPSHLYGTPDDLRRFIDRAHAVGIGVILDVVYNHFGPVGNYLRGFSPAYFTDKYENEWGDAINFDGADAGPVREFFIANAGYWIDEFHFDGLRLDATQQIFDASSRNVMTEIGAAVRERARGKGTLLIAENEPQHTELVRPEAAGGYGLDMLWNDDFHHSAMVAVVGHAEAYYSDTYGEPQELISAAKYGYLYQGQFYAWQQKPRGTPALDIEPARFVAYLQNHDQVANSARGLRGHQLTSPGRWRAITALLLLMPATPMLFQGQEFAASTPFLYFADFDGELAAAVRKGRAEFLHQFPSAKGYDAVASFDAPEAVETFERCRLDFTERTTHGEWYALHRDLLQLRRETPVFATPRRGGIDGAVIGPQALALRFFVERGDVEPAGRDDEAVGDGERLLIVNLGRDLNRNSIAEPLVAPPVGCEWTVEWCTEDPRYGGMGVPDVSARGRWCIPGESATVLKPRETDRLHHPGRRRRTA